MTLDDWRLRWLQRRNRLLASPGFQRLALRWWPTRRVARRRARALFDLVAGFTYSQVLYACVKSGLIDRLGAHACTVGEVAAATGLPGTAAERLLRAAAALDLAERVGDRWVLGQAGAALAGQPGVAAMVAHHDALYADLADPLALLARGGGGGALSRYWRYAESPGGGDADAVAPYSRLMAASLAPVADQALGAYDFTAHRRLLDIGGGEGRFLGAVAAGAPGLALGLFDLPAVVDRARDRLAGTALADRTTFHAGDFLRDPVPAGYDLVTLVRILHDHDDAPAAALLAAIRGALPPGGRLLIVEPLAATPGAQPAGDAYFGLYLLAMGSGRPRPAREILAMLATAGFARTRELSTTLPLVARVILAESR